MNNLWAHFTDGYKSVGYNLKATVLPNNWQRSDKHIYSKWYTWYSFNPRRLVKADFMVHNPQLQYTMCLVKSTSFMGFILLVFIDTNCIPWHLDLRGWQ